MWLLELLMTNKEKRSMQVAKIIERAAAQAFGAEKKQMFAVFEEAEKECLALRFARFRSARSEAARIGMENKTFMRFGSRFERGIRSSI